MPERRVFEDRKSRRASDDGVRRITIVVSILVLPFLLAASALLYLFPADTESLFAWTIAPPLTAMVLASAYIGGVWFFSQVLRQRRWHRVRYGFPAVLLFATLLGCATALHWDRFHFGHVSFVAWAALYFTTPILVLGVLVRNWRADPGEPDDVDTRIPLPARIVLAGLGAASLATGLTLFLAPGSAGWWAWELTPLTARVVGAVLTLPGAVNLWLLVDGRWSAFRWILQAQLLSLGFLNLAVLLSREQLRWGSPGAPVVVVGLMLSLALYVWVYLACEVRARTADDPGEGKRRRRADPPRS